MSQIIQLSYTNVPRHFSIVECRRSDRKWVGEREREWVRHDVAQLE